MVPVYRDARNTGCLEGSFKKPKDIAFISCLIKALPDLKER
jgi:hypothetical protein